MPISKKIAKDIKKWQTNEKYILDGHTPVEEHNLLKWGRWFEDHTKERIVQQDYIERWFRPPIRVSTVFLGLDHNFSYIFNKGKRGKSKPILFETMIFGGKHDQYQVRYYTWDEAVEGHKKALDLVKNHGGLFDLF